MGMSDASRLGDGDALGRGVDDEDGARKGRHLLDAAEVTVQALDLLVDLQVLLLRQALELAARLVVLQAHQVVDSGLDGREVRQRAAEPAIVDVRHHGALGFGLDGLLRLPLGAAEQDRLAAGDEVAHEVAGLVEVLDRLLEVDDVDAVALGEDVRTHARVPALRLVAEVDAGFKERLHAYWRWQCWNGLLRLVEMQTAITRPLVLPQEACGRASTTISHSHCMQGNGRAAVALRACLFP